MEKLKKSPPSCTELKHSPTEPLVSLMKQLGRPMPDSHGVAPTCLGVLVAQAGGVTPVGKSFVAGEQRGFLP